MDVLLTTLFSDLHRGKLYQVCPVSLTWLLRFGFQLSTHDIAVCVEIQIAFMGPRWMHLALYSNTVLA